MKTLSAILLGATALASSLNASASFDLNKEIRTVMQDPRAPDVSQPQWQRSSYQAIIDAARLKRLSHGNPYDDGVCPVLPTTVQPVSGVGPNITGKTSFTMRYVSDARSASLTDTVWGDDEDIVYVTGSISPTSYNTLTILPGTIVLVAAHQDDKRGGAQTQTEIDYLATLNQGPDQPLNDSVQLQLREPYFWERQMHIFLASELNAKGTEDKPITIAGDDGTPYDFFAWYMNHGIADFITSSNSQVVNCQFNDTIIARSYITNNLESCRNGPGWVIANYFGNAHNECIATADWWTGNDFIIQYNTFNNPLNNSIGIGNVNSLKVEHNEFIDNGRNEIAIGPDHYAPNTIFINYNNMETTIGNASTDNSVDATNNYWTRTPPTNVNYSPAWNSPDSDLDGLTDAEEANLGTNPYNMDSDYDGRIDGLEIYGNDPGAIGPTPSTEPLDPDTDRDGKFDGYEILNGTDPNEYNQVPATGLGGLAALVAVIAGLSIKSVRAKQHSRS